MTTDRIIVLREDTTFGGETGAGLMGNRCAFTSKDMAEEFDSAFTYAIVSGWDNDPDDDPEDYSDAMADMVAKWGWDEPLVAFLRDAHERFKQLPQRHEEPTP